MLSLAQTIFNLRFLSLNFNILKWQAKQLLTLSNIETNKINKKQSKMNLTLHIDQSFKYEYSSPNFNFNISI